MPENRESATAIEAISVTGYAYEEACCARPGITTSRDPQGTNKSLPEQRTRRHFSSSSLSSVRLNSATFWFDKPEASPQHDRPNPLMRDTESSPE